MSGTLSTLGPVALVGAGKMGLAMAGGWIQSGLPGNRLTLVDPKPSDAATAFASTHGAQLATALKGESPSVLVLAVKPQVVANVFAELRPNIDAETLVVSVVAGISIARLSESLGTDRVVRTMPNTPAQIGKGVTGAVPGAGISEADRGAAEAMMTAAGDVLWFDKETDLDAVTAISGCGPAYVFHLVEAMSAAGREMGLPETTAMRLARGTVVGAAALLDAERDTEAATLRENVTSPNGVTAEALKVWMRKPGGLTDLMVETANAARRRSEELGRD